MSLEHFVVQKVKKCQTNKQQEADMLEDTGAS